MLDDKDLKVSILNASGQTDYMYGLVSGLAQLGHLYIEVIHNDRSIGLFDSLSSVRFLNLVGDYRHDVPVRQKVFRLLRYYFRLIKYAATTDSKVFHIQWLSRFQFFEQTFLTLYYKVLCKKLVLTAHNVDTMAHKGRGSVLSRLSRKCMYSLVDHIIVHTEELKRDLRDGYGVPDKRVTVIPHGINNKVTVAGLSQVEGRERLGIGPDRKVLLVFGGFALYKGIDILVESLPRLLKEDTSYFVVIAGCADNHPEYLIQIKDLVRKHKLEEHVLIRAEFIPDEDIEMYFAAADCLVLPYRYIYQSGVVFLSYRFGLPIVATAVGGLKEAVIHEQTGFLCSPCDPADLAEKICQYFKSPICRNLEQKRHEIAQYANEEYSWNKIAKETVSVYNKLLYQEKGLDNVGT